MPSPALTLWIDMSTGKFLSGWQSISFAQKTSLKQGDLIGVELHIINNYLGGSFSEYEFSPSTAVTLAIGRIDTAPESGTFKLTYGGLSTAALSAEATAAQVQTALNALAVITTEGGVVVTKTSNSYRIVWNTPAVTANVLSYSFNELYPTSTVNASVVKAGSLIQKQIYQVHIKQAPVANITSFVNQTAPAVTVTQIHAPAFVGDTKVWRVSISPQPKNGSFLIGFDAGTTSYNTAAVDVNSSGDTLLSALTTTFNGSWSVVKSGQNQWDIATTNSTVFNLSATDGGINAFNSKYGILDLDTAEVEDLLAGDASADAVMEIQLDTNGVKHTVTQQDITILNDLIDDASYSLVQWGDYIPADSVVRYDTAQALSNAQKQQAKDNIGISTINTTALTNKDIELEGRIGDLEGLGLTTNQFNAIIGSQIPSATNVLTTKSALDAETALKANVNHSHIIFDITGLQSAIDARSLVSHTHLASDVTGLSAALLAKADVTALTTGLSGKSDTNHTHTIFSAIQVTTLDTITENADTVNATTVNIDGIATAKGLIIDDLDYTYPLNGASQITKVAPPFDKTTANPSNLPYTLELPIKIDGIVYMIPARLFV
jgi:hypothetical protein